MRKGLSYVELCELGIKNYCCISDEELRIRIDNIVVLIGPNNVGKSTVLSAYESFQSGSALNIEHFHKNDTDNPIEIAGIFTELNAHDITQIGTKWVYKHEEYGDVIKYKWVWSSPGAKGTKFSWNAETSKWEKGGMGGWDSKISSCIPYPLKINPFDDAETMEKKIIEILSSAVKETVKKDDTKLSQMLTQLNALAGEVKEEISETLNKTTEKLESNLNEVFPDYKVQIQPEAGKLDVDKIIAQGSHVRIVDPAGADYPLNSQGTGLQRTFLWSAIESLADTDNLKVGKKKLDSALPRILLVEEPESFLHPPAVRAAREALYKIAELMNWQVMITTHSPIFIDVSKEHTTIIRVDKGCCGNTSTFSTDKAGFDADERKRLQMIRACHPTVNEFFFSNRILLVEGDTEQAVFNYLKKSGSDLHVLNCFGKANIPMFQKILNHFGVNYSAVHDIDSPKSKRKDKWITNAMWTMNSKIYNESRNQKQGENIVIANMPDFEGQFFGYLQKGDKPYNAILELQDSEYQKTDEYKLLLKIANGNMENLDIIVDNVKVYEERVKQFIKGIDSPGEKWSLDT